jgi:predicted RNA-binding Zn-ribbon protein involved in translation (DUF1610 family)
MTDQTQTYVAICAACGYQWNETADSTFFLNCPTCGANLCHKHEPDKAEAMGEEFDGAPWY